MPALSRHFWLLENIQHDDGAGFSAELPSEMPAGDSDGEPSRSPLVLFEDNVRLGAPHSLHDDIRKVGRGRYSHWSNALFFSSSDNTDPRQNGRDYIVVSEQRSPSPTRQAIDALENLPPDFSRNDAYRAVERCLALIDPLAKIGEDEKSFWRDRAFIEAYETFEGRNYRALERKYVVFNLVRALAHVPGDLAECGVFNGATSYFMALARSQSDRARRLHLFDSFEGLSAPDARDGTHWRAGDLSCSLDDVAAKMRGFDHINFYPGWIPTQFHRVADKAFSFVHIDVDLHAPTADSIEFFYPRLSPGGMLLCDDYGFSTCPGATEAMDEFFKTKPERVIHLPTGQGLVIKAPSP